MTRDELIRQNEALHQRRAEAARQQPRNTTGDAAERVVEEAKNPQNIIDLYTGDYTPPAPVIVSDSERWNRFDWSYHPALQAAKQTVIKWWNEEMANGGGLILAGPNGVGKTEIARALKDLFGPGAAFLNELTMTTRIRDAYGNEGSEYGILNPYKSAKLLILDDVGADENCRLSWIQGLYAYLLDRRKEQGWPTVITTNLRLEVEYETGATEKPLEARLGIRAFDRLAHQVREPGFYVSLFEVPSYRRRGWV